MKLPDRQTASACTQVSKTDYRRYMYQQMQQNLNHDLLKKIFP